MEGKMYSKSFEIVGYTYEADLHCLECTEKRFNVSIDEYTGFAGEDKTEDREGNNLHPIFLDQLEGGEVCGDCFEQIE
jgi:hypothetical protein